MFQGLEAQTLNSLTHLRIYFCSYELSTNIFEYFYFETKQNKKKKHVTHNKKNATCDAHFNLSQIKKNNCIYIT